MIDLYFWTTPNGYKPLLFLEEARLAYAIKPVNISSGAQFDPAFAKISPTNRIPAIVDHHPAAGGAPVTVFESGAILHYLAEKTGRFLPAAGAARAEVMQWLFWQMGGVGPMFFQNLHFSVFAPEKIPYAINRYVDETNRLMGALDRRLADREFVAGDYSIADMAIFPWVLRLEREQPRLDGLVNVRRWYDAIDARPATIRAYKIGVAATATPTVTDKSPEIPSGRGRDGKAA